uniref:Uncharacterized protein n=1 Tax=Cacopsylla melanoneura TaxID=428564 RepID=A0A8D9FA58_9HEMI
MSKGSYKSNHSINNLYDIRWVIFVLLDSINHIIHHRCYISLVFVFDNLFYFVKNSVHNLVRYVCRSSGNLFNTRYDVINDILSHLRGGVYPVFYIINDIFHSLYCFGIHVKHVAKDIGVYFLTGATTIGLRRNNVSFIMCRFFILVCINVIVC